MFICEYLLGKKILVQDLDSDGLYEKLAHLLRKIHYGKNFQGTYDVFRRIGFIIQNSSEKCKEWPPLKKIETTVIEIQQTLARHTYAAPCHNDLYNGNIVFTEQECKAIDYGDAGQNDPYYDLATVAATFPNKAKEILFLTTCLGRPPSPVESAKFYLMKQIVLIKWMCDRLKDLSTEQMLQYDKTILPPKEELMRMYFEEELNMGKAECAILNLKDLVTEFLENSTSAEFTQSMTLLTTSKNL